MSAVHDLSALELAAAIRTRELSPVEITDHYLARIDRHNAETGAFITVLPAAASNRAKRAEAAVMAGDPLPPLHGVPIGFKDLNHTKGVRTTMGSALYRTFVPDFDDHVVALVEEAGVNSLGKTNVPEFGFPFYTENLVAPPARTPWNPRLSAGGSSGGAAAAVAAGLLPFAHASDGGGSLRVPASVCGLFGFKPSRGRVSNGPVSSDVTAYSCHGAITRTVADAAALLDAMVRPIPTEPYHAPSLPRGTVFGDFATPPTARLRVGRYCRPCRPDTAVAGECLAAWEHASTVIAGLGHHVVDIDPPFDEEFWHLMQTVNRAGRPSGGLSPDEAARLTPLARWMRGRGAGMSAAEFLSGMTGLRMATRRVITATEDYDVLLTPTLALPPRPVGWFTRDGSPATTFDRIHEFSPFTPPYNVTGQPAATIPLWWTVDGLPIGVMLAGRPFDEATLLSLATELEQAFGWRHRVPEIW